MSYTPNGSVNWQFIHRYHCLPGKIVDKIYHLPDGKKSVAPSYLHKEESYHFQANVWTSSTDELIQGVSSLRDSEEEMRTSYNYDDQGNLTSVSHTGEDGRRYPDIQLSNDKFGNPTEIVFFNEDGSVNARVVNNFEYDSHGNWIKNTIAMEDAKSKQNSEDKLAVLYRTITYRH